MVVYMRGGIWTNVEDEIVRAAVSKYGLNQWARVSSLLAKKTPKQVKARWNEWLDPSVKKMEWSKEEDEKLLHLAKLMPSQWRTIASMVGRTATQCLERYQLLLDEAEARESDLSLAGPGAETAAAKNISRIRKLQPGEIDPDPETKPARPDAIDMDEDEKEMLSEARARLANTQGKKAKRKDRERMLEESRRLAFLQRRHELKQAGINVKLQKKRKNEMDYSAEIPFEKAPPRGFYNTVEEDKRSLAEKDSFSREINKHGQMRSELEEPTSRHRSKKRKESDNISDLAAQEAAEARRNERIIKLQEENQISNRKQLVLSAPQITNAKLEEILRIDGANSEIISNFQDDDSSTSLLNTFSKNQTTQPFKTPHTIKKDDSIYRAALELKSMSETTSSLLGHEATPIVKSEGSTLKLGSLPEKTPNLLLSTIKNTNNRTLYGASTVRQNNDGNDDYMIDPKEKLRNAFRTMLPAPKNNFEIILPDEDDMDEDSSNVQDEDVQIEDSGDRDARIAKEKHLENMKKFDGLSEVLKKNLLRVNEKFTLSELHKLFSNDELPSEVITELEKIISSDNKFFPEKECNISKKVDTLDWLNIPTLDNKSIFMNMIKKEMSNGPKIEKPKVNFQDSKKDITKQVKDAFSLLSSETSKVNQLEKKINVHFKGYMARDESLRQNYFKLFNAFTSSFINGKSYEFLSSEEEKAIKFRTEFLQNISNDVLKVEREKQETYDKLTLKD